MAIQPSKPRIRVKVVHKKTRRVLQDRECSYTYAHIPMPTTIGVRETYIVEVEYVGDHQYKQPYAKRLAAQQRNQKAAEKHKKEVDEKALVLRQKRIMNQIELAFEKKGKDAVNFVTCDKCEAPAKFLGLAYENSGSATVSPEQITGAMCDDHNNNYHKPYKTTAVIACSILEFFYDGIKQIYINRPAQQ
jgi:hypothetical protein